MELQGVWGFFGEHTQGLNSSDPQYQNWTQLVFLAVAEELKYFMREVCEVCVVGWGGGGVEWGWMGGGGGGVIHVFEYYMSKDTLQGSTVTGTLTRHILNS